MTDWTGNYNSIYKTLGASNHTEEEREPNDYYATDPKAVEILLEHEKFNHYVWENACGEGHIADVLKRHGYDVKCSDLIDRGYEGTQVLDFLKVKKEDVRYSVSRDIITNPPYKFAKEFVEHALDISMDGTKVAMLLKLTFLEGKARRKLFEHYPPEKFMYFRKELNALKTEILKIPVRAQLHTGGLYGRKVFVATR